MIFGGLAYFRFICVFLSFSSFVYGFLARFVIFGNVNIMKDGVFLPGIAFIYIFIPIVDICFVFFSMHY